MEVAKDVGVEEVVPPRPKSTIERFLEVRGLKRADSGTPLPLATGKVGSNVSTSSIGKMATRPLWHTYTKRRHGERTDFQRRAMRIPDESFSDSVDVYNPKKRPTRFLKVHEEADETSVQFLHEIRHLFFEREVVDREVCDLTDNRATYDELLDRVYYDDGNGDHDDQADEPTHNDREASCDGDKTDGDKTAGSMGEDDPASAP